MLFPHNKLMSKQSRFEITQMFWVEGMGSGVVLMVRTKKQIGREGGREGERATIVGGVYQCRYD